MLIRLLWLIHQKKKSRLTDPEDYPEDLRFYA